MLKEIGIWIGLLCGLLFSRINTFQNGSQKLTTHDNHSLTFKANDPNYMLIGTQVKRMNNDKNQMP